MTEHKKSMPVRIIVTVIYVMSEPNPDAMIPFTENESAFIMMAFGFPFMLASCLSVVWAYGLRKSAKPRRNSFLALIPAIIDGIPFVVVAGILLVMLVEGFLEVLGILP